MKHVTLILTMLMLSACAWDAAQIHNPELRLMFQPDMLMHVASEGVGNFPEEQSIGVIAWKLQEGESWNEGAQDSEQYLTLCEACSRKVDITDMPSHRTVSDVLWVIDSQPVWPDWDESLTFMAFSPYCAECGCDCTKGVTYGTDIMQDQTDLLYTAPMADRQKLRDGWVVPLHFEHALCEISFRVKNRVADNESIKVRSISLDGVRHKGSFASLASPQWTLDESKTGLDIFEGEFETGHEPEPIGRTWLMIPQELETQVSVEYQYTTFADTYIVQNLKTVALKTRLEAGKSYVFTLSVGIDDVKFLTELIEHRMK